MADMVENLRYHHKHGTRRHDVMLEAADEIERLRELLGSLKWKSTDKDNMEFQCNTTCFVMDKIHKALKGEDDG